VILGLSLRDMALVAVPPALLFLVLTDGLGIDLSWAIISICLGSRPGTVRTRSQSTLLPEARRTGSS